MPFVSESQRKKCWVLYNQAIAKGKKPTWDCKKWEEETKKSKKKSNSSRKGSKKRSRGGSLKRSNKGSRKSSQSLNKQKCGNNFECYRQQWITHLKKVKK